MASPSAPTWVVTAALSRPCRISATSRVVLLILRVCILLRLLDLSQRGLYLAHVLDDRVRLEAKPGGAFQACLGPDDGLEAPGRALQALPRALEVLAREHAVKDRGLLEIRAHPDAGDRYEALDARVRQSGDLLADDLFNLGLDLA